MLMTYMLFESNLNSLSATFVGIKHTLWIIPHIVEQILNFLQQSIIWIDGVRANRS